MEKWITNPRFPTFPRAVPRRAIWYILFLLLTPAAPWRQAVTQHFTERRPTPSAPPTASQFQAHPALESNLTFRLIVRWNQTSVSGSFVDWKMLRWPGSPPGSFASAFNTMGPTPPIAAGGPLRHHPHHRQRRRHGLNLR